MALFSFEGLTPRVHARAFLAPTATLVGDVIVEEGASVWYGAVIRADYAPVIVRRNANVQDNAVIHGPPGLTSDIGPGATIPAGMLAAGAPAVVKRPVKGTGAEMWVNLNPGAYAELAQRHRLGIRFVDFPPDGDDD